MILIIFSLRSPFHIRKVDYYMPTTPSRPITAREKITAKTLQPSDSAVPTSPRHSSVLADNQKLGFRTCSLGTSAEEKQRHFYLIKGHALTDGVAAGTTVLKPSTLVAVGGNAPSAISPSTNKHWESLTSPFSYADFLRQPSSTSSRHKPKFSSSKTTRGQSHSPHSSRSNSSTSTAEANKAVVSETKDPTNSESPKTKKGVRDLEFSDYEDDNKEEGCALVRTDSIATVRKRLLSTSTTPAEASLVVAQGGSMRPNDLQVIALDTPDVRSQSSLVVSPSHPSLPPPPPKAHALDSIASTQSSLNRIGAASIPKGRLQYQNMPITARPPPAPHLHPPPPPPIRQMGNFATSPLAKRKLRESEFGVGSRPHTPHLPDGSSNVIHRPPPLIRKPLYTNILLQQCILGTGAAVTPEALMSVTEMLFVATHRTSDLKTSSQPSLSALRGAYLVSNASELILDNRVTLRYGNDRWRERFTEAEASIMGDVMTSRQIHSHLVAASDFRVSKAERIKRQEEREQRLVAFWKAKEEEERRLKELRNVSAFGYGQGNGYGVRFHPSVVAETANYSAPKPLLPAQPPLEELPPSVLRNLLFASPASTIKEWVIVFRNTHTSAPPTSLEQYRANYRPKEVPALMGFDKNGEVIVVKGEGGADESPPPGGNLVPTKSSEVNIVPQQEDLLSKSAALFVLTGKRASGARNMSIVNLEASVGRNSILGKGVSSLRRYMTTSPHSRGSGGGPVPKTVDSKKLSRSNSRKSVASGNKKTRSVGRVSSFYRKSFKAFDSSNDEDEYDDSEIQPGEGVGDGLDPDSYNLFNVRKGLSIPSYLKPLYTEMKNNLTFVLACLGEELNGIEGKQFPNTEGVSPMKGNKKEDDAGNVEASSSEFVVPSETNKRDPDPPSSPISLVLSLSRQPITVDQLTFVLGRLEGHTNLQKLAIRQSGLDTVALVTLGEWALRVPPLLSSNGSLHTIDLSGNRIKSTDLPCLEAALFLCPFLRSLSLRNNPLRQRDDTFAALESLLFAIGDRLEHLDVGLCGLNDSGVGKICSYLRDAEASSATKALGSLAPNNGAIRKALLRTGGVAADAAHSSSLSASIEAASLVKGHTNLTPMIRLNMDGATISTAMATLLLYTLHTNRHLLDLGIAFVNACNTKSYLRHVSWLLDRNLRNAPDLNATSVSHQHILTPISEPLLDCSISTHQHLLLADPHAPHPPLSMLVAANDRRKALLDAWERRDKDTYEARQRLRSERASVVAESLKNLRLLGSKSHFDQNDTSRANSISGAMTSNVASTRGSVGERADTSLMNLDDTLNCNEGFPVATQDETISKENAEQPHLVKSSNLLGKKKNITPLPAFCDDPQQLLSSAEAKNVPNKTTRTRVVHLEAPTPVSANEAPKVKGIASTSHPQDQALHELLNSTRKGSSYTKYNSLSLNGRTSNTQEHLDVEENASGLDSDDEDGFTGDEEKALEKMLRDAGTHGGVLRGEIDSALPRGYGEYTSNASTPRAFPNPYYYIPSEEEREGLLMGGLWNGGGRKSLTKALSALRKFQTIVPMRKRGSITGDTSLPTRADADSSVPLLSETGGPLKSPPIKSFVPPRKRSISLSDASSPFSKFGKGSAGADLLVVNTSNGSPLSPRYSTSVDREENSNASATAGSPGPTKRPPLVPHRPSVGGLSTQPPQLPLPPYSSTLLRNASSVAEATPIKASITYQNIRQSIVEGSPNGEWVPKGAK